MKAEYNHWYKCQEGQMPEDFENVNGVCVLVWTKCGWHQDRRDSDYDCKIKWKGSLDSQVLAWMLPEPYKE